MQYQMHTEVQALEQYKETVAIRWETVETIQSGGSSRGGWRVWVLLLLVLVALAVYF